MGLPTSAISMLALGLAGMMALSGCMASRRPPLAAAPQAPVPVATQKNSTATAPNSAASPERPGPGVVAPVAPAQPAPVLPPAPTALTSIPSTTVPSTSTPGTSAPPTATPATSTPPASPSPGAAASPARPKPAGSPAADAHKSAPPAANSAATPAPQQQPKPSLDLNSLEQRLKDTRAIGVFTKLSLKNQVDDLLTELRAFHAGSSKTPLSVLRQEYDLLILKVLSLLQGGDPQLATAVASSREAIWGILMDPQKFSTI